MSRKHFRETLILAVLYYIAAVVSMEFMVEPEKALPFFPPAGIALGALLAFGRRLWPGIFIAGFLFNAHNFSGPGSVSWFDASGVLPGLMMTSGATLQALAGVWLLRRFKVVDAALESFRHIFIFLLLAGPVSCLISATVAVYTLSYHLGLPVDAFYFTWFSWWAGDTIGSIIFAPAIFLIFNNTGDVLPARKKIIQGTVLLLSVLTLALFHMADEKRKGELESEFKDMAFDMYSAMNDQISSVQYLIKSYVAYYGGSEHVDPHEYRVFTDAMRREGFGLRAIGWAPYVRHRDRKVMEERMSGEYGYTGFQFTEKGEAGMVSAKEREFYVPVYYIEPHEGNEAAFGFDLASHSGRLATIMSARESGEQTATEPIRLVQEIEEKYSFLMMEAVYDEDAPLESVKQRQEAFRGVISGVISVDGLISGADSSYMDYMEKLNLYVEDVDGPNTHGIYGVQAAADITLSWQTERDVGGRVWRFNFSPKKGYLGEQMLDSLSGTISLGLGANFLLIALILVVAGRADTVQRLVDEKTDELNDAQRNLHLILDNALEGIYGIDVEGHTTFANKAAESMVGYSIDEMKGVPQHELIQHHYADGSPYPREDCSIYKAFKEGRTLHEDGEVFWKKDGSSFPVEYSSTPIKDEAGEVTGAVVVFRDISERLKAQKQNEQLLDILNRSTDYVSMANLKGEVFFNNRAFEELLDYRIEKDGPIGVNQIHPEWVIKMAEEEALPVANAKGYWNGETAVLDAAGNEVPVDQLILAHRKDNGELDYYSTVMRDVTERRRMVKQLESQKHELERSNQELDDFAYIASHDLREPLRGMQGFAGILRDEYADSLDESGREYADMIAKLGAKADMQIRTLLQYSRLGRSEIVSRKIDLIKLLDEVRDALSVKIESSAVRIELSPELPENVVSDETLLKSVLQNLIDNAIKYNDAEEKRIEIGYVKRRTVSTIKGERIIEDAFYVKDNGIGVSAKFQDKIFTIFKRLHNEDQYEGGSGAGFTIVKKAIARLGGDVLLESKPGEGSCFYFTLKD